MKIKILGNGGCINKGLNYNSFIINDELLCEVPPDIMYSLHHNNIDYIKINKIFISHFHADHYFGIPFLMLSLFILKRGDNKIKIIGPKKVKKVIKYIVKLAFSRIHPVYDWLEHNFDFIEINEKSNIDFINDYKTGFYKMSHFIENYGFTLEKNDIIFFTYLSDTVWNENIESILKRKPKNVLLDLNGEDDDIKKVHLSERDLIDKALNITFNETDYYGTHLKSDKTSNIKKLKYVKNGDEI